MNTSHHQTPSISCTLSSTTPSYEPSLKRNDVSDADFWQEFSPEPDCLPEEADSPIIGHSNNLRHPQIRSPVTSVDDAATMSPREQVRAAPRPSIYELTASDYHSLCCRVFRAITLYPASPRTVDLRKVTCSQKHLFFTFDISVDHLFMLPEGCYTIPEEY